MMRGSSRLLAGCRAAAGLAPHIRACSAVRSYSQGPGISKEVFALISDHDLLRTGSLVGSKWTTHPDTYEVINPATGGIIASMSKCGAAETRQAIASAGAALRPWRNLTGKERSSILRRWHSEILKHTEDIATLMTLEGGKPLAESRAELQSGAGSVEWMAEEAKRVNGDQLATVKQGQRMLTIKQPVGVVAAITPWNFPMSMITRKVAPALAAGCTVVLKPATQTPLTALALAVLARRAGVPDGVLNLVTGDSKAIGDEMLENETVRKIGFTGSTAVGKHLLAGAAATVKRVSMELGGNAPLIVFSDCDLELAADGVVASGLRNAGQTCICANRILIEEGVYDKFVDMVAERVRALAVGNGMDAGTKVGPCINEERLELAAAHVDDAVAKGASVVCGGARSSDLPDALKHGFFFQPTVLKDATREMRIFQEETFAPVLPMFRFKTEEEAIELANDTPYGLAAYFYTNDLSRAWRVAEELEYGMVGVNETSIGSEVAPFGGVKQSGLGRENGNQALNEFLEEKYICMGLGR